MPASEKKKPTTVDVTIKPPPEQSGHHVRDLEAIIRDSLETALPDLQTTSAMSRFELEDALAKPEARPTGQPPPRTSCSVAVEIVPRSSETED